MTQKTTLRRPCGASAFALRCSCPLPRMFASCSLLRPCGRPCGASAFALRCSCPLPRMFAPCSLLRPCERPYGQRRSPCAALALCPNVRPLLAAANLAKTKAVSLGQKCNGLAGLQPAALLHNSLHILLRLIGGFPRQSR